MSRWRAPEAAISRCDQDVTRLRHNSGLVTVVYTLREANGDQYLDVVLSHAENGRVSVLLNTGQGVFTPAARSPYDIGREAFAVALADANRDKLADLFVATGKSVTVLLGNGRTFAPAPGSPFRAGPGAYNVAVGDINEDGKPDVVA